jgi:GT2 family glycosyltransferase
MTDNKNKKTKYYGMFYSFYGINVHKKKIDIQKIIKVKQDILVGSFNGASVFFKKDIWSFVGGYDSFQPIMHDCTDLGARAYLYGYKNYLFNKNFVIHIGKEKDENKSRFSWKYRYYCSGVCALIFKNYKPFNIIFTLPIFFIYSLILFSFLSIKKKNLSLLFAFFISYLFLIKNIPYLIKKRKEIQLKRITKKDLFLEINPLKFD